jgi:hypothetical protein
MSEPTTHESEPFNDTQLDAQAEECELVEYGFKQQRLDPNRGDGIKLACLCGLVFSALFGLGCTVLGSIFTNYGGIWNLSLVESELVPLALNIPILLTIEVTGYIHSTSLRWALFYEIRLCFHANLCLLTCSKTSWLNGRFVNVVFFLCGAFCYASSSMVLSQASRHYFDGDNPKHIVSVIPAFLIAIGLVVLIQCILSGLCVWVSKIPT